MSCNLVHFLGGLEVGGKERVVLQLARRARSAGCNVRLLLFDTPFRNLEVDLDPGDLPVEFSSRGAGVDLHFALALRRWLRGHEIDLIHAHNDTAIFYAAAAAALAGPRVALCGTFHTKPGHATRGARSATRIAAHRADRITAVSDELAQLLLADGWVERCDVIWNGIDLVEFAPIGPRGGWRERLSVPQGALLVGHIGRFDPVKRHGDLIAAARSLREHDPELVFVCVGQGPLHEAVRRLAADLPNVRFVPRIADVPSFLRELDAFVLCSEHEAAPRALLEALACGLAVIATGVGGIPSMLRAVDGTPCGEIVPPRNVERIAQALHSLAIAPELRRELGRRARERAAAFAHEVEWNHYVELYRSALARRGGPARDFDFKPRSDENSARVS